MKYLKLRTPLRVLEVIPCGQPEPSADGRPDAHYLYSWSMFYWDEVDD